MTDEEFFRAHPDRQAHIRKPDLVLSKDAQRSVRYLDEEERAFRTLGPHDKGRRRILLWRTPADHPTHPNRILKVPMLAFSDESIEDADEVLLPVLHGIMEEARANG